MGRSQGVKPLPCVLGQTTVDNKLAVVLNLIPNDFLSLGNPPNFSTCTRDTFPEGFLLSVSAILKIVQDIICAICTMHDLRVAHGDIYAHNIMFAGSNRETVAATLCDFGASTYYHGVSRSIAESLKKSKFWLLEIYWKICRALLKSRTRLKRTFWTNCRKCKGDAKIVLCHRGPRCLG